MAYRTKTYVAGDWTGDKNAIDQLYKWKNGNGWGLTFVNAHDLTSARDTSLNCSIKRSLKTRLDVSKRFVLIVGSKTSTVTSGSCKFCSSYNSYASYCARGYSIDFRSYIKYECDVAKEDISKIVVLYNSTRVDKTLCPEALRYVGTHVPMIYSENGKYYWDYYGVKKALEQ